MKVRKGQLRKETFEGFSEGKCVQVTRKVDKPSYGGRNRQMGTQMETEIHLSGHSNGN